MVGKKELVVFLFFSFFLVCGFGLCSVCLRLFSFPLGVIGRLYFVIMALKEGSR